MIDLEVLLTEIAPDLPCGPDLAYEAGFQELELAAWGKPEQQFGETLIRAEEPDWNEVRTRALALFSRTKDLRVAVLLTRALVNTEQFSGLGPGLRLIVAMLERYWDVVHPRLDEDDGDATIRLNTLHALANNDALLRDLRNCTFVASRALGRLTVRDVEIALGRLPVRADSAVPGELHVEAILTSCAAEDAGLVARVNDAADAVQALSGLLADRVGAARAPDLGPLRAVIGALDDICKRVGLGASSPQSIIDSPSDNPIVGVETATASSNSPISIEVRNRQDAIKSLERVCEFLERTEPANPAPLFIRRALRLMSKGFVDILRDVAPDSVSQFARIAGIEGEQ